MSQEKPPALELDFDAKTARVLALIAFVCAAAGALASAAGEMTALVGSYAPVVRSVGTLLILASALLYRKAPSSAAPKVSE